MAEEAVGDQQDLRVGRRRLWMVGSLVALLALAATFVQTAPADAATHVGIGEPRIISTKASPSGSSATLGVRVRSAKNVKQVRIYLFTTSRSQMKKTVIAHLSKGTNNYGYWTGTATFSDQENRSWRIGKVRVLGSQYRLLRSKTIAKNTAAVLIVYNGEVALVANGRTQGPESARTTKFALQVRSDNDDDPVSECASALERRVPPPFGGDLPSPHRDPHQREWQIAWSLSVRITWLGSERCPSSCRTRAVDPSASSSTSGEENARSRASYGATDLTRRWRP